MKKYMYWSKTNNMFIKIWAQKKGIHVYICYENMLPFKTISILTWNSLVHSGNVKEGWDN